jgi:O-antigen/teichoic acid export membrane protein
MAEKRTNKILVNFIWRFAERCGAQLVTFIVSIVLARILEPEDYGQIALITVFTTIMQVFVDSGLGTALIQKKDADDLDFSSVFYFNFAVCLILYAVMFVAAPFIAGFYNNSSLTPIIRVISLMIVISGVKGIQQSYVSRNMLFKRFFYATLGGTIFSAFLGIGLAYAGFGVWAIVAQQLSNTTIDTLILWLTVKWRPKKMFSWERLKGLLSFGWKMLASSLLDTIYTNIRSLIIGKMYSSADLAYYNQGEKFPNVIASNINTSIDSVLLPTMACVQDDHARVKSMTRRAIKTSTYIMAPLMMGLAFCAEPIVRLVLTDKWLFCVPFLRIFCITYMFYPIHTANLNAIKAMGRSDLFLKLEIAKKVVGMTLLLSTMWFGVMAMAYSLLISSVLSQIINAWPNRKLVNYGYLEQLKDILPGIALAVFMGCCVSVISMLNLSNVVTLLIQIPLGAVIYIVASAVLHLESYEYLMEMIRSLKKIRKLQVQVGHLHGRN